MSARTRSIIGAGILGLALSFSLVGCGGEATAPAEEPAPQEEAAAEPEATDEFEPAAESEAAPEPESAEPVLAEGLTLHENDLLTIGIPEGWSVPADAVDEVERFEYEDGESGYSFNLEYDDESIGRRSFAVIVYDDETYDWVSYEVPADSDRARNTEALDPITINGVEFVGHRSINTGMDGTEYHYALYMGVVDGHYIEILCTDGSADGVLFEDQMSMARSIHIKYRACEQRTCSEATGSSHIGPLPFSVAFSPASRFLPAPAQLRSGGSPLN